MSKVLALKKLMSRVIPVQNDTPPTLDDATQAAREELRQALVAESDSETAFTLTEEHVETAESAAESITEALAAARDARSALMAFVQDYIERGEKMPPDADAELRAAEEAATRHLSQVKLQAKAAKAALPSLHARVQVAKQDNDRAKSRINEAIGRVLIETLRARTRGANALVEQLNRHIAEIVAVTDLMRRRGFYGSRLHASVPDELKPQVVMKFPDEALIGNVRPWKAFAERLREDPDASFE